MNRFLKAGPVVSREFLEAKYGKGGIARGAGKTAQAADEMSAMQLARDSLQMGEEALRARTAKSSPLQSISEEDISMVSGIGFPKLRSEGKVNKKILQGFIDDALEEATYSKRSPDRFIEKFMDFGLDFEDLDDVIFASEKIPPKFRKAVEQGEWPEFDNLRMGYIHEIQDGIRKALKKSGYGKD